MPPSVHAPRIFASITQAVDASLIERDSECFWSLLVAILVSITVSILAIADNAGEGYALALDEGERTLLTIIMACAVYLGCIIAHDARIQ